MKMLPNGVYNTTNTGARTHRVYNDGVYTYEYDANGSVLTRKANGAVERTFVYNDENQLTDVRNSANLNLQSNFYDGDGARVKTVTGGKTTYTFNAFYERETGGYGLDFDGVDDYVTIPDSPSNGDFNAQITLEAWIRPDGYPGGGGDGYSCIVTKAGAYYLNLDTTGHLQFYWYGLNSPGYHKSPNVIPTNQWTHVAATYDGSKVRLYENGVQVKEVTVTGSGVMNTGAVGIGRYPGSAIRHFNGRIDEVRILNRALSAAELREDYSLRGYYVSRHGTAAWYHLDEGSGTSVTDASGNANTGTRSGAAWVAGMGGSGSSVTITKYYYFNGERIALRDNAGLKYLHADHLGSASKMSCGDTTCGTVGGPTRALWYDPWGAVAADSGAAPVRYQYTGQAHDATGLYFYNARYYDSALGRFIQADTIVPSPANPQSLNRYSYVYNNPLKYVDPTGHDGTGGGILGGTSSDPNIQLAREQEENELHIVSLIQAGRWDEYRKFIAFLQKVHPGSIGVFKWSGRFPGPGDVGHAVVGADEGVFIGTGGYQTDYGVYMSSAAEIYQNEPWLQQLEIYEVQGMSDQGRKDAATFALNEYGAGYSYAGLWSNDKEASGSKKWYCSELTVAALEKL